MLAIGKNYKKATGRYFGFSANLNASIQKTFGKIGVGPNLLLPVYDNWKKDKVFPQEQNNKSRDKWFRGIGIGLTGIYSLSNKH